MIYVFAIRTNQSGGSESLHQFASVIQKMGANVRMVYPDSTSVEIPDKFKGYNLSVASEVVDSPSNIIVVPETETKYLYKYFNVQKCIWWLSRDFYYGYCNYEGLVRSAQRHNIKKWLYPIYVPLVFLKKKFTTGYFKFGNDMNEIFHLYNCEYVREYLLQNGVEQSNMLYMCGPVRNEYFGVKTIQKEPLVTYNPKKNYIFTSKILKVLKNVRPDIKVVAIEGMKSDEIAELLNRCSVYIDFGQFPGPERIPREAVTCNCNLITSRYGSTRNDVDVPIPEQYKVEVSVRNIGKIVKLIQEMVDNYSTYVTQFDAYRKKVKEQPQLLEQNARVFLDRYNF
jgi:hypothetical protein